MAAAAGLRGTPTYLALRPDKIQAAFDYFNNNVWTKTPDQWRTLCAAVDARDLEFSIICDNVVQRLEIKIWADDPKSMKDAVCESTNPFWVDFHKNLNEVLPTKLEDQPCIL